MWGCGSPVFPDCIHCLYLDYLSVSTFYPKYNRWEVNHHCIFSSVSARVHGLFHRTFHKELRMTWFLWMTGCNTRLSVDTSLQLSQGTCIFCTHQTRAGRQSLLRVHICGPNIFSDVKALDSWDTFTFNLSLQDGAEDAGGRARWCQSA